MFGSGEDEGGSRSREITCVKVGSCVSYGHKGTQDTAAAEKKPDKYLYTFSNSRPQGRKPARNGQSLGRYKGEKGLARFTHRKEAKRQKHNGAVAHSTERRGGKSHHSISTTYSSTETKKAFRKQDKTTSFGEYR